MHFNLYSILIVFYHFPEVTGDPLEAQDSDLIGMEVESEAAAYELYNNYAFQMGFGIRKSRQYISKKTGVYTKKEYCCSKAGHVQRHRTETGFNYVRVSGCKAHIKFAVDSNGIFRVTRHEVVHNHVLCPKDKSHLLRSQRQLKSGDMELLLHMNQNGIKVSDAFRFIRKERGGAENIGFTKKDAYNKCSKLKRSLIVKSDANSMINKLQISSDKETDFYFKFEFGDGARLACVYWRDSQMKLDYDVFGDSIVVDATYSTNTYGLKCVPFVGFNHHGSNVMFGCGLLTDEKTQSYDWLFKHFLLSMNGKEPETIMTDQSASMSSAIAKNFKKSHHRLCYWHLVENSKKHIRHLRSKDGFVDMLNKIMKYTDSEAEFTFYWERYASLLDHYISALQTKYECITDSI